MEPKKDGQGFHLHTSSVDCMEDAIETPWGGATFLVEVWTSLNCIQISNRSPYFCLQILYFMLQRSLGTDDEPHHVSTVLEISNNQRR